MPLDPQLAVMIEAINSLGGAKTHESTPEEARAAYDAYGAMNPRPDDVAVDDLEAAGHRARMYRPADADGQPLLLFFHGGGFVIGSIESHDATCAILASASGCNVLSAEYRLAPEHPYPAAHDDALAIFEWTADRAESLGADPTRIAVGGDSAGGLLTASLSVDARDGRAPAMAAQVLIYPWVDEGCDRPSMTENAVGYVLERATVDWFIANYAQDPDAMAPHHRSPIDVDLAGVAPAVVVSAGYCPFRDQNFAYVERLEAAGVDVRHLHYPDLIHTFIQVPAISEASRAALVEVGEVTAKLLSA
ncbi:MAG TPA: alpha/beta hydrolase [Acidimicrobiia bacterium]|nr:alpha/beta hydrolase [Acidimicrobiia bacterium]